MLEFNGNIWDHKQDHICIPTNGSVKASGECVMGRGLAFQAKQKVPGIALQIGAAIKAHGNHFCVIGYYCAFPVKHRWWEKADPALIAQSARELRDIAERYPTKIFSLPRPGCGNGGLRWLEVRPMLVGLPNNIHIVDRAK